MNSSPDEWGVPVSGLEAARLRIAHLKLADSDDLWRVVSSALRVSGATLEVTRVGLWFLSADRKGLLRVQVHDARPERQRHSEESWSLPLNEWPAYRAEIVSRRVVAAGDAKSDPRTCERREGYLDALGITSVLDAPLFIRGEVWGVVCHEHVGPPREWTQREIDFALSVADMLSTLFEQSARIGAEKQLRAEDALAARAHGAEALVRCAAGVAHDFNTVLQAIATSASAPDATATILAECQRAARIVDQLVDLSRPRQRIGSALDLSFVVDDLRGTLDALLGDTHALVTFLSPNAFVPATRADLERILLNLVSNARDAMPDGGTVTVTVTATGAAVVLQVADHGIGIDPATVDRIFEPYFTTKEGKNSGLGMFVVQTLAQRSGAAVSIANAPRGGTAVMVAWSNAALD